MRRSLARTSFGNAAGLFGIILGIASALTISAAIVAAWITHVIVCIKTSAWVLLLFGCIVAPVGVMVEVVVGGGEGETTMPRPIGDAA